MATRRTQIEIVVLGLSDLRSMNTALLTHEKRLSSLIDVQNRFNAAARQSASSFQQQGQAAKQAADGIQQQTRALKETEKAQIRVRSSNDNLLQSLLKLRGVEILIANIGIAFRESAKAAMEYEKQAARIARVLGVEKKGLFSAAMRADTARTGKSIEEVGEAYYQLGTFVKETDALFAAHRATMNLVVGTESDVRDTARAVVAIYNQYGDQLDKTASQAENFRRIGELFAISFKQSNTEVTELIESLKYLSPIATAAKVPLGQLFATIGALDKAGIRGSMAGTNSAQFITNLIKKYDDDLGGIVKGDKLYKFEKAKTANGGLDLLGTLRNIVETANRLPQDKAEKFLQAVSGSQQSFRVVGALKAIEDAIPDIEKFTQKMDEGLKGNTREAEKLAKIMQDTVGSQLSRTWQSTLGVMSQAWDNFASGIHLKGLLKDIADAQEAWLNLSKIEEQRTTQLNENPRMNAGYMGEILRNFMAAQAGDRLSDGAYNVSVSDDDDRIGGDNMSRLMNLFRQRGIMRQAESQVFGLLPGAEYVNRSDADALLKSLDAEFKAAKPRMNSAAGAGNSAQTAAGNAIAAHLKDAVDTPQFQASCAYFASAIMQKAGLNVPNIGSASGLRSYLTSHGAKAVPNAEGQAGDYALFYGKQYGTWRDKSGNGYHAAIYMGNGRIRQSSGGVISERDLTERERQYMTLYRVPDSLLGKGTGVDDIITDSPAARNRKNKAAEVAARKSAAEQKRAAREAERLLEQQRDEATERAVARYELTRDRYGIWDSRTQAAANEADRRALLSADGIKAERLRLGIGGSRFDLRRDRREMQREDIAPETMFGLPIPQTMVDYFRRKSQPQVEAAERRKALEEALWQAANDRQDRQVGLMLGANDAAVRRFQRGIRPNSMYGLDPDIEERGVLLKTAEQLKSTLLELQTLTQPTDATSDAISRLRDELTDTETSLRDLDDRMQRSAFQKGWQRIDRQADDAQFALDMKQRPVLSDQQWRQEVAMIAEQVAIMDRQIADKEGMIKDGLRPEEKDSLQDNIRGLKQQRDRFNKQRSDIPQSEYLRIFESVRSNIVGAGVDFLRGRGSADGVIKTAGDSIVDAILTKQLQGWLDPLVIATTNEIAAMQGLQVAINANTAAQGGKVPAGQSAAGGGAVGVSGTPKNAWNQLKKVNGLTAGLAAYSVFSQAQETGVTAGGLLGGALTGLSVGGPIGAGIGFGLSLLGGLFGGGKKRDPLEESKNHDPSFYNSPSDFDYYAYLYRATGRLPTADEIGLTLNQQPAPVVNVYAVVDGVATKVKSEMTKQTQIGRVAQTNATFNLHENL